MTEKPSAAPEGDIRPLVGQPASNRGIWLFAILLAVAAGWLFATLEVRRTSITSPAISVPTKSDGRMIVPPPDLFIPPEGGGSRPYAQRPFAPFSMPEAQRPNTKPTILQVPQGPAPQSVRTAPDLEPITRSPGHGDPFASDRAYPYRNVPTAAQPDERPARASEGEEERAYASRFINPATTVPKGTIIQAVLETALNSNHPGYARAIVSRDASSFDGSRVLIPKGSKLFGEYKSDVNPGQNRALIRWQRLTRPDGTIINVDSPTADPLGRAGVKGSVDTHFFTRFGGAILQSVLDLGVQLAAREATGNTYVIGIPYGMQQLNPVKPEEVQPTLKIRQGTSVSVFVARDLDFTDVE